MGSPGKFLWKGCGDMSWSGFCSGRWAWTREVNEKHMWSQAWVVLWPPGGTSCFLLAPQQYMLRKKLEESLKTEITSHISLFRILQWLLISLRVKPKFYQVLDLINCSQTGLRASSPLARALAVPSSWNCPAPLSYRLYEKRSFFWLSFSLSHVLCFIFHLNTYWP